MLLSAFSCVFDSASSSIWLKASSHTCRKQLLCVLYIQVSLKMPLVNPNKNLIQLCVLKMPAECNFWVILYPQMPGFQCERRCRENSASARACVYVWVLKHVYASVLSPCRPGLILQCASVMSSSKTTTITSTVWCWQRSRWQLIPLDNSVGGLGMTAYWTGARLHCVPVCVCVCVCVCVTWKTIKGGRGRQKESHEEERSQTLHYVMKLHHSQLFPTQHGHRKREEMMIDGLQIHEN